MRASIQNVEPQGIYTASQAIQATGICRKTFYNYVRSGRIKSHFRALDCKRVYRGFDLIEAITGVTPMAPLGWGESTRTRKRRKRG